MSETDTRDDRAAAREARRRPSGPDQLEVIDESEEHRGHGGWHEGGGTHFRVVMRAASLDGAQPGRAQPRGAPGARRRSSRGGVHALALDLAGGG